MLPELLIDWILQNCDKGYQKVKKLLEKLALNTKIPERMTYVSIPKDKINLPIVLMTRFGFGMKASHLKYVEKVSKPIHC